ncbi:MAG: DUF1444 family protein [Sedimentisphaerales bacterium]|nr:DUF1444 family protein [Sedimentisphaerales bacterium]
MIDKSFHDKDAASKENHVLYCILLTVFVLMVSGCEQGEEPDEEVLSEGVFTDVFIARLQKADPTLAIERKEDLHVLVSNTEEREHHAFLDNIYKQYLTAPEEIEALLDRLIQTEMSMFSRPENDVINRERIVPVIKDAAYPEAIKAAMAEAGNATDKFDMYYEPLNERLVVFYAVDNEQNMSFLCGDEIKSLDLDSHELRELSMKNLRAILPEVRRHGESRIFLLAAGGDYEASLLLSDKLWTKEYFDVQGDIVVAVPSRDVLLVTGSNDVENLAGIRKSAEEIFNDSGYALTTELFVRRGGKWVLFEE